MAAILPFQHRKKTERQIFEEGHTAMILLYTGVRFERIDFEALKSTTSQEHIAEPAARFAN